MSDESLLNYATPRVHAQTPRPNWLAVFSFAWTFALSPTVVMLFFHASDSLDATLPDWAYMALGVLALVAVPAAGFVAAIVATERGAGWDSPYRWTGFAVCAGPVASVVVCGGLSFCLREFGFLAI